MELLFNGYRVSVFQDEKCSADGCWYWLHSSANVVNATNCTLKVVKTVNFMLCVF